jgi:hypothetical protein
MYLFNNGFVRKSSGFPDVVEASKRVADEYGLDPQFYAAMQLDSALGGKSKVHIREIKYKATQWIRLNRPHWGEMEQLDQVTRVLAACSRATPAEDMLLDSWTMHGVVTTMQRVARWTVGGVLPNGEHIPTA